MAGAARPVWHTSICKYASKAWQEVGPRAAGDGVAVGSLVSVTLDPPGNPALVHIGTQSDQYILYAQRFSGGTWPGVGRATGEISAGTLQHRSLVSDAAGTLYLVFQGTPQTVTVLSYPELCR